MALAPLSPHPVDPSWSDTPDPHRQAAALSAGELLLRIRAAACCPTGRAAQRTGDSAAGRSGVAGIVEAVADDVGGLAPGDEVFGVTAPRLLRAGTERTVLAAAQLAPKPRQLDFAQAAALPTAAVTAWQMLFEHGRLERRESVVILGAERLVGRLAVQMTCAHGVHTVAVAPSRHGPALRALGAALAIDASPRVLEERCRRAAVVIDVSGGIVQRRALLALGSGSLLVSCVARPEPAVLAKSDASFALIVARVTACRLAQVAALVDRGLLAMPAAQAQVDAR